MERAGFEQWSRKEVARLLALIEGERDYYRDIADALPVALASLSSEGTVVSANRAFRDLFGMAAGDLGRKTIDEILPAEPLLERLRDLQHHGIAQPGFSIEHGHRKLRISLASLRAAHDSEMETLLLVEGEWHQPAFPAPAIGGVPPRVAAAPANSVTDARQDALRALSARLAHDLNNPLMIIAGYAEELLESAPAGDPRRAAVEQILAASQRIGHLTGQLLAFTRPQAKPPQPVDVNALIRSLQRELPGKPLRVELAVGANPLFVSADSGQLREILLALASPAREGARERTHLKIGCESVTISAINADTPVSPGPYAMIALEDNGQGYSPQKSALVFESFLSKEGEPTVGADLARAYAIARAWSGGIAFSSQASGETGRGSVFRVYLPLADPASGTTGSTVMVVDDEPEIRGLVAKILRREKYNVLEAADAREALAAASMHDGPLGLLITDVMLGGQTGPALAAQLREALPDLKILYISGNPGSEPLDAQPGAQFLQKPFTLNTLLGKVRGLLPR